MGAYFQCHYDCINYLCNGRVRGCRFIELIDEKVQSLTCMYGASIRITIWLWNHYLFCKITIKDARSVYLYPYNRS